MPTIAANGIDIAYEAHGAGPPLVLLHGATSLGREDFAAQIPLFSKAFRCIVPDARGHGGTRWDAADGFRYDWLVDDLAAFVDELGLETFHLLGFSMGAMTALQYGARHPDRLRTIGSSGSRPNASRGPRCSGGSWTPPGSTARTVPGQRSSAGATMPARAKAPGVDCSRQSPPTSRRSRSCPPRDLHRIDAPAIVACGDRDPFVPVEHASGIAASFPMAGSSSRPTAATR